MSYWPKDVPVAARKAKALKKVKALKKKGQSIQPVEIQGRIIARSFWGKAWCEHLEKFSDYENRLPRGRTYARNGSVVHLEIRPGRIEALVSGSELYKITIAVKPLSDSKWSALKATCSGNVSSALELLQGKISDQIMTAVCDQNNGLFPVPSEITLECDCPDWAELCKHLAAVLYGVGARLDQSPELLFLLRDLDYSELIATDLSIETDAEHGGLESDDLGSLFGIDMGDELDLPAPIATAKKSSAKKTAAKKVTTKKTVAKKTTAKKLPSKRMPSKKIVMKNVATKPVPLKKVAAKKVAAKRQSTAKNKAEPRRLYAVDLLEFRLKHRLNVQQLAKLCDKPVDTIQQWEQEERPLQLPNTGLTKLERVLAMKTLEIKQALGSD